MASLLEVARTRRLILGFTEADVTVPRRMIREHRERTGEAISLTAYVTACLARAVARHPSVNAARRGRHLILFDDVAVVCYLEHWEGDEPYVGFHPLRGADHRSVRDLTTSLRSASRQPSPVPRSMRHVPMVLFGPMVRYLARSPRFLAASGVLSVSNVGSGGAPGWGFAPSATTVEVTIGGIAKRPALSDGQWEEREILCLTIAFDHDVIDGAAAARLVETFLDMVASGDVLRELDESRPEEGP